MLPGCDGTGGPSGPSGPGLSRRRRVTSRRVATSRVASRRVASRRLASPRIVVVASWSSSSSSSSSSGVPKKISPLFSDVYQSTQRETAAKMIARTLRIVLSSSHFKNRSHLVSIFLEAGLRPWALAVTTSSDRLATTGNGRVATGRRRPISAGGDHVYEKKIKKNLAGFK